MRPSTPCYGRATQRRSTGSSAWSTSLTPTTPIYHRIRYFEPLQSRLADARDFRSWRMHDGVVAVQEAQKVVDHAFNMADAMSYYAVTNEHMSCRHYDLKEYYPDMVDERGNKRPIPDTLAVRNAKAQLVAREQRGGVGPVEDVWSHDLSTVDLLEGDLALADFNRELRTAYPTLAMSGGPAPTRFPYVKLLRQFHRQENLRPEVILKQPLPYAMGGPAKEVDYTASVGRETHPTYPPPGLIFVLLYEPPPPLSQWLTTKVDPLSVGDLVKEYSLQLAHGILDKGTTNVPFTIQQQMALPRDTGDPEGKERDPGCKPTPILFLVLLYNRG